MRFKILATVGFILLGIVTFSVYSSSNNESVPDDRDMTAADNESSKNRLLETNENGILEVNLTKAPLKLLNHAKPLKPVIVNPDKVQGTGLRTEL